MSRRWDEYKKNHPLAVKEMRANCRRKREIMRGNGSKEPEKITVIHRQPAKPVQKGFFSNIKNRLKDFFGRRK